MRLHVTPDQLSTAGACINNQWGSYGYTIEGIESPTTMVALFRVVHSDGSRFTVAVDRWGNCRDWGEHDSLEGARVLSMHETAMER